MKKFSCVHNFVVEMLKKAEEFIKGRYKIKERMADIGKLVVM